MSACPQMPHSPRLCIQRDEPSLRPATCGCVPRTIGLLALCGAASALLSCTENTVPTAPAGDVEASAAAINKGLSICSWGLADFTGNGAISYLASDMNDDGAYQTVWYSPPGSTSCVTSSSTAGLTTVYKDTLVVVSGNLPASEHSSGGSTAITLALDLRLVVTPPSGHRPAPERRHGCGSLPSLHSAPTARHALQLEYRVEPHAATLGGRLTALAGGNP